MCVSSQIPQACLHFCLFYFYWQALDFIVLMKVVCVILQEMMVQVGDLGKDYEHCMALHRKLDDVDSDMRVDDTRFTNINKLADKIIKQGCDDNKAVRQRKNELNHK